MSSVQVVLFDCWWIFNTAFCWFVPI